MSEVIDALRSLRLWDWKSSYDVLWRVWNVWGVDLSGVRMCQEVSEGVWGPETHGMSPQSLLAQAGGNRNENNCCGSNTLTKPTSRAGVWMGCKRWQWLGWIVCLPPPSLAFQSPGYNYLLSRQSLPSPAPCLNPRANTIKCERRARGHLHLW